VLEEIQVFNDVLDDENIGEFSLNNDNIFDNDYTQSVTPGTHMIGDRVIMVVQEEDINVGLGGMSSTFMLQSTGSFPAS
jgi:hypothetical protein